MALFRFSFPSFEKPVERQRYLNLEPETHEFRGVGAVLLLAASCGVALALWEPSQQVTTPFATTSASRSGPAAAAKPAAQETTAIADPAEDEVAPIAKLSTVCSQRATARRDCASAKALKDARLNGDAAPAAAKETKASVTKPAAKKPSVAEAKPAATEPKPAATEAKAAAVEAKPAPVEAKPAVAEAKPAHVAAKTSNPAQSSTAPAVAQRVSAGTPPESPAVTQPEAPAAQPKKTAAAPKAKRQRAVPEEVVQAVREAPVERLVKVYEQVMPDGRRVPVYRRQGSGGYETGTIVDGEYRPARRAEAGARFFGLQ
jgi:hypothetical protein